MYCERRRSFTFNGSTSLVRTCAAGEADEERSGRARVESHNSPRRILCLTHCWRSRLAGSGVKGVSLQKCSGSPLIVLLACVQRCVKNVHERNSRCSDADVEGRPFLVILIETPKKGSSVSAADSVGLTSSTSCVK